ncbi:hypothetical protein HDU85_004687 [Gaertneriomyces sp. JEL0708]|nr:hypothetical protein HDU85_004687 [Gaertneriomyces sp. JEL0708]
MHPELENTSYPASKPEFYELLCQQAESLLDADYPAVTNLANLAALLYHAYRDQPVPRQVNWAGFYLTTTTTHSGAGKDKKLMHLGPFQGRVACTVIPFGKGVCGTAAAESRTILVKNVHDFPGHIACDSQTNSEIVVPLVVNGHVVGVLDLDCLVVDGFDQEDQRGLENLVDIVLHKTSFQNAQ